MTDMTKSTATAISDAIKAVIKKIDPDVGYADKYGGEVIVPATGDDKSFVGGIFSYKDHVSLEFSNGASFDDPNRYLEGKGKNRRHLKLSDADEVSGKDAEGFLKQALAQ